ncbi:MAG: hypothetical protein U0K36_07410 [Bacteroidales bacterium]|nr:hypothetical protein [Bacteroidales bacterium]
MLTIKCTPKEQALSRDAQCDGGGKERNQLADAFHSGRPKLSGDKAKLNCSIIKFN